MKRELLKKVAEASFDASKSHSFYSIFEHFHGILCKETYKSYKETKSLLEGDKKKNTDRNALKSSLKRLERKMMNLDIDYTFKMQQGEGKIDLGKIDNLLCVLMY